MIPRWSLAVDGETYGPYTDDSMRNMVATGQVAPETLAWKPGAAGWAPVSTFEELAHTLAQAPPASQPAPISVPGEAGPPIGLVGSSALTFINAVFLRGSTYASNRCAGWVALLVYLTRGLVGGCFLYLSLTWLGFNGQMLLDWSWYGYALLFLLGTVFSHGIVWATFAVVLMRAFGWSDGWVKALAACVAVVVSLAEQLAADGGRAGGGRCSGGDDFGDTRLLDITTGARLGGYIEHEDGTSSEIWTYNK